MSSSDHNVRMLASCSPISSISTSGLIVIVYRFRVEPSGPAATFFQRCLERAAALHESTGSGAAMDAVSTIDSAIRAHYLMQGAIMMFGLNSFDQVGYG